MYRQVLTREGPHRWPCPSLPCPNCSRRSAPREGVNLIQDAVRVALQELIEPEATNVIGAERYVRTSERKTERNGSPPRTLTTTAGDVRPQIPKLCSRSGQPRSWRRPVT